MENHFDTIRAIYDLQKEKSYVALSQLEQLNTKEIIDKFIEYDIVEMQTEENYRLRDFYVDFLSGLFNDYSLDMPAQIAKYRDSLLRMSTELKVAHEKNEIVRNLEGLEKEIVRFEGQLKRNIKKLIEETKQIKANNSKLAYAQKVKKASELSRMYLVPLNLILEDHSDSISHIIKNVIEEAHEQKLINSDRNLQDAYARVYTVFQQVKKEILSENRLLVNEVTPLLERIKTESQILTGCINYLANPSGHTVPNILDKKTQSIAYSDSAYYDARDIWDGYSETIEDVVIGEVEEIDSNQWRYDNEKYMEKLEQSLPNDNYYFWVYNTLNEEIGVVESKSFLELSKLIIVAEDLSVTYTEKREEIVTEDKVFNVPVVQIKGAV